MSIENVEIIVYIVFEVFYAFIVFNFYRGFLALDKKKTPIAVAICVFIFALSCYSYLFYRDSLVNIFVSIIALSLLSIPYTANLRQKITTIIIFFLCGLATDLLSIILLSFLTKESMFGVLQTSVASIIGIFFSRLALALFCIVSIKILRHRQYSNISNWYWIAIMVVPIGSMITIISFFTTFGNFAADTTFIILISFIAIINFFIFFIYDKILEDYMNKNENKLLSMQIEYYDYELEQIKISQMAVNSIKHDIEKHLLALQIDLDEHKFNDARESITMLIGDLHMGDGPANSGNASIDAILNYKANTAKEYGINIVCDLQLPFSLDLNATDIAVIFGNALDNAIDACKFAEVLCKIITVTVEYERQNLYIAMSNPYAGSLEYSGSGDLKTKKENKSLHGIGLRNIEETIKKYDGLMDISTQNGCFNLKIILFNVSEK